VGRGGPLFCGGYTVMSGYRAARPRPGERVAVLGIGGLGHLAVQVAKAFGHEVVAVTATEEKREEARGLGADEVLVVREDVGKALAGMGGVDIILGTSNSMVHTSQCLEGLKPQGRLVSMGISRERISIEPLRLLDLELSVIGGQQTGRENLVEILELAAAGKVRPRVEHYRLDEIQPVMERLREGKVRHRAVLMLGD
jgi:Zn-dependent alcohol dehydrogenases